MGKKSPPEDIQAVREHRKKVQRIAQAEKLRRQKAAQERRDALDKERALRSEVAVVEPTKPAKKKPEPSKNNPIDPNDVINNVEHGIPFSAEDIAQKINLEFSKGSPNRKLLGNLFDQFLTAGIIKTDQKGRFIKPFEPDTDNADTLIGVVIKKTGQHYFRTSDETFKQFQVENCQVPEGSIVTVTRSANIENHVRVLVNHGNIDDAEGISKLTALEAGIPIEFPQEVLDELVGLKTPPASTFRKDYTDRQFITIDPETAKDKDDAVYVEPLKKQKGYRIMVAIADVSEYVHVGSAIFNEALKRGNTSYLPGLTIPKLPEVLSNGLCSLNQGEVKAAIVQTIDIDLDGNILKSKKEKALIRVCANLNYDQVQEAMNGHASPMMARLYQKLIAPAKAAAEALEKETIKRGALELDVSEQRIDYSRSTGLKMSEERQNFAHKMIAYLMIAANRAAGLQLENNSKVVFSRAHGTPVEKAYESYIGDLQKLGIEPNADLDMPDRVRDMVDQTRKLPTRKAQKARQILIRMQDRARYKAEKVMHYGLGLMDGGYVHFTSPIRRFADLVVHSMLTNKEKFDPEFFTQENLDAVAKHITMTERRSAEAERKAKTRMVTQWVANNMSRTFNARVLHVDEENKELEVVVLDRTIHAFVDCGSQKHKRDDIVQIIPLKADKISGLLQFKLAANSKAAANTDSVELQFDGSNVVQMPSKKNKPSKSPRMKRTRAQRTVS